MAHKINGVIPAGEITNQDKPRRTRLFRRFAKNTKGATAIEFAILAFPFCLLVFAILESTISFATQQVMANAGDSIARELRTGQLRAGDVNEAKLKDLVCGKLEVIVADGCPGLEVDLREFPTFDAAAKVRVKLTSDKDIDTSDFAVTPGDALSINMLRVFYRWPVMTDLMRSSMSNLKDGKTLLFSTITWRNEPYS
ncbi:MAG: TadE/TadG family type IV pilus assembly protein [Zhengella sp.]|uniref:TadE/TadG family type IV pilus assembly protein n=1 Tax=Zhengella sp. TaxID=2282762 RepID=UPI001D950E5B|nr:pilus assembly protein [Notoacmeibacter sp.]MCC0025613.1 pilus assembly protein [Brucellaceae bacterium]